MAAPPPSPSLSPAQLSLLARHGEERTAAVGDVLFEVGDATYPFIAIREGEVAIHDAAGNEIVRAGATSFLGEMNLLSGQTVFLTAVVTKPLRYVEVDREALRTLLFDDGPLSNLVLSTFIARRDALQTVEGIGIEIVGPHSSSATMQMLDFARANRLPLTWHQTAPPAGTEPPLIRLPGGTELHNPSRGEVLPRARCRPRARTARGSRPARRRRRLLHRRADLRETMSDYLIRELDRYRVVVRDRSEIASLHGTEGRLEAVTLKTGERLPFSFLFFFLGAQPCTEWLDDAVARAPDEFILTDEAAGAEHLLETSVPGIFAAGDVRCGSTKRRAAAVGEGSMAVQFVHQHLAASATRVG